MATWEAEANANYNSVSHQGSDLPSAIHVARTSLVSNALAGSGGNADNTIVLITTGADVDGIPGMTLENQAAAAKLAGIRVAVIHVRDGYGDGPGYDHQAELTSIASFANPTGTGSIAATQFYYPITDVSKLFDATYALSSDLWAQGAVPGWGASAPFNEECLPNLPYIDCDPVGPMNCLVPQDCPAGTIGIHPQCFAPTMPCVGHYAVILPDSEFGGAGLMPPWDVQIQDLGRQIDTFAQGVVAAGNLDEIGFVAHNQVMGVSASQPLTSNSVAHNNWLYGTGSAPGWIPTADMNFANPAYSGSDWAAAMAQANNWFASPMRTASDAKVMILVTTGIEPPGPGFGHEVSVAASNGVRLAILHIDAGHLDDPTVYEHDSQLHDFADPGANPVNGLLYRQVSWDGVSWDISSALQQIQSTTQPASCL